MVVGAWSRLARGEPEVSEHVARAKANHPKGEVRWRGALILPHEGLRQLQEPELREHVARARPEVSEHVARATATHPRVRCDGAEPSSCRTRGLRPEPEASEHVARAKATHPTAVGALMPVPTREVSPLHEGALRAG